MPTRSGELPSASTHYYCPSYQRFSRTMLSLPDSSPSYPSSSSFLNLSSILSTVTSSSPLHYIARAVERPSPVSNCFLPRPPSWLSMSEPDQATIQRAIIIAQNAANDNLDQQTKEILQLALRAIWRRIQSQPDTYVLTNLEARVFNYHQSLFRGNEVARHAWARYWENTHGMDGINGH